MKQNGFSAKVIKTGKINVDDSSHGLPPHLGSYPEFKVADYHCPDEWSKDGVFIPVKEGDPLWFDFRGNDDECAILCAVQRINPVTGEPADLDEGLTKDPTQNYLRMPEQQWLDGYANDGKVYQFVVTKSGIGLAVNEHLLPAHMQDSHAIGFAFFGPKNPKPKPAYRQRDNYYPILDGGWTVSDMLKSKAHGTWASGSSTDMNGVMNGAMDGVLRSAVSRSQDLTVGHISNDIIGTDINQVFCNSVESANTKSLSNTKSVCVPDVATEDRVADNFNEVETVDILAEQEGSLNELEKASMAPGGRIGQSIITDDNTTDYYHEKRSALLAIYFALPEMYDAIMKKGKKQDASKKDKYKTSGHIGGVAIPLITQEDH
jgi:hypothetical protein